MKSGLSRLLAGVAVLAASASLSAGAAAARQGQVDPRRLVDHLRYAGGRHSRAMRDDAERRRRGPAGDRPLGGGAAHADNKAEILRVLAPLGVLLPNGLGLNVDGKDIGRAYFVRCFQDGCYAEVIWLEKPLLDTLQGHRQVGADLHRVPDAARKASASRSTSRVSAKDIRGAAITV
jgi:invasion protein IalB